MCRSGSRCEALAICSSICADSSAADRTATASAPAAALPRKPESKPQAPPPVKREQPCAEPDARAGAPDESNQQ